jgi:hypothetical protein
MRSLGALLSFLILTGVATAQTTKPAEIPTNSKDRKVHPATQPGQVLEISLAELGNFDFDPEDKDAKLPDDVKALTGVTVKLHGFMVPMDQADQISKFALIPTFKIDSFHPIPIQQTIVVTCPPGKPFNYCGDEIIVQGKLAAAIMQEDGFVIAIFAVDNGEVSAKGKMKKMP